MTPWFIIVDMAEDRPRYSTSVDGIVMVAPGSSLYAIAVVLRMPQGANYLSYNLVG